MRKKRAFPSDLANGSNRP